MSLLTLAVAACGSSKGGSPTGPGAVSGLTAPAALGISELSVKDRTTTFTWNAVPGATGYVLEIGRTSGGTEFAVITVDASTTYRASDMPVGISYARVRAKNAGGTGSPSADLRFVVPDLRDIAEALFLGTGPNRYDAFGLTEEERPYMVGWPQGTNLPTRVAGGSDQDLANLQVALQQVADVTNGALRTPIVERLADAAALTPTILRGELRVLLDPDMGKYCGNASGGGCGGASEADGVIVASRLIAKAAQPASVVTHELGHAVLGLKHIQWAAVTRDTDLGPWPGLGSPTMLPATLTNPPAGFSPTELDAIRMVYAAGLRGGAQRAAFLAAGVIRIP